MSGKRKYLLLILSMTITFCVGCNSHNGNKKDASGQIEGIVKEEDDKKEQKNMQEKDVKPEKEIGALKNAGIYTLGENVDIDDIDALTMNSVRFAFTVETAHTSQNSENKMIGDSSREMILGRGIEISDIGELDSNYAYLWLNVTVENLQSDETTWAINEYQLAVLNDDLTLDGVTYETIYWDGQVPEVESSNGLKYTFSAGEKKDFEIGFVIPKEILEKKIVYFLSPTAPWEANESSKMILIDQI